jgi:hypothetical protein
MSKFKLSRKQREAKRAKIFAQTKPGRPHIVRFSEDPKRFEICLWFILTNDLKCESLQAAMIAAAILGLSTRLVPLGKIGREGTRFADWGPLAPMGKYIEWPGVSLEFREEGYLTAKGAPGVDSLNDRAMYLHQHADDIIASADKVGRNWLAYSAAALLGLLRFAIQDNMEGVATALGALSKLGWELKSSPPPQFISET